MNNNHIKELARSRAREILSNNQSFRNLPIEDQKKMYLQVVDEQMGQLRSEEQSGYALEQADRRRPTQRGNQDGPAWMEEASDLVPDREHDKALNFDNAGEALQDVMDAVDFPKFVRDLLKSVFDANIDVMNAQTQDYIKLMKAATTDLSKFITSIDKTAAFAYLAENNPDEFNISLEEDEEEGQKMELTDPKGNIVDYGDNQIKSRIMDAKIKMAQEHRAALREMILMGVTRLVVDKGEVEAEVLFDFKGKRSVDKKDKAILRTTKDRVHTKKVGGIFGIGGRTVRTGGDQQTQLSVSSAKSSANDELNTKLRGFVNIKFKTDYFKLDNFAEMYAPPTPEQIKAADSPESS